MQSIDQHITILEAFREQVLRGRFFENLQPGERVPQRARLNAALRELLVWQRPAVETCRDLDWPYRIFRDCADFFEQQVSASPAASISPDIRREALLFLALLPFPGQWKWLKKALHDDPGSPELNAHVSSETQAIAAKLAKKSQKRYKLRHFCQVLKKPKLPDEKGVLRIFSLPYVFADEGLLAEIGRSFIFYVEPPMGVVFRHTWLRLFSHGNDPCVFGVGGAEDADFILTQPNTVATHLAHGDYLESGQDSLPADSAVYDLVFNATFDDMRRKRHAHMLDLLLEPRLARFNAVFLGRGSDANVQAFREMVYAKGLQDRVTVMPNLRRGDVPGVLAKCRMGVHLSLYENNCRAIYEYLRADIPVVVSSSMAGMNMDIFNRHTGLAVQDNLLAHAIRDVDKHRAGYSPRQWFWANTGSDLASRKLNAVLKEVFARCGYRWTEDIVQMTSSGATRYAHARDYARFHPEFERLLGLINDKTRIPIRLSID